MADQKARDDEAERKFIEREQALAEERRYVDLQQSPDCGKAHRRLNETARGKHR